LKKTKTPQSVSTKTIGDKFKQGPTALFGLDDAVAGVLAGALAKGGIDLGKHAYKFFKRPGSFQVCVEDSRFIMEHHVILLMLINCSPHGIYVEKLDVSYTNDKEIVGVRKDSFSNRTTSHYSGGQKDRTGFPKGFFQERVFPLHLPPAVPTRIMFAIPKVEGGHDVEHRWGRAIFTLTHLKDGKRETIEEEFGLRWTEGDYYY
jgi:hypothetical protein